MRVLNFDAISKAFLLANKQTTFYFVVIFKSLNILNHLQKNTGCYTTVLNISNISIYTLEFIFCTGCEHRKLISPQKCKPCDKINYLLHRQISKITIKQQSQVTCPQLSSWVVSSHSHLQLFCRNNLQHNHENNSVLLCYLYWFHPMPTIICGTTPFYRHFVIPRTYRLIKFCLVVVNQPFMPHLDMS